MTGMAKSLSSETSPLLISCACAQTTLIAFPIFTRAMIMMTLQVFVILLKYENGQCFICYVQLLNSVTFFLSVDCKHTYCSFSLASIFVKHLCQAFGNEIEKLLSAISLTCCFPFFYSYRYSEIDGFVYI